MIELLFVALIQWPKDCDVMGDVYARGARLRDRGRPLKELVVLTDDDATKRVLMHVYSRPDMTPEQWRWFIIGACTATPRTQV